MINIFDFDGVICDPWEDCIFRLEESPLDAEFIQMGRDRYGITHLSNHTKRNRHLILQEVLYELKVCPAVGPLFNTMKNSSDPFMVLTARAGPGAVARVCQFFEVCDKRPEEMFFVGPVSKTHVLKYLSDTYHDTDLVFYDDSIQHFRDALDLNLPNLKVHWVDNRVETLMGKAQENYEGLAEWLRNQATPHQLAT